MTETSARAPQVVRRQPFDPGATRCYADNIPQYLGRRAVPPHGTGLVDRAEDRARCRPPRSTHPQRFSPTLESVPFAHVLPCRQDRQSPSAPPVVGSIRGADPAARSAEVRSQAASRSSRGRGADALLKALWVRGAAGSARVSTNCQGARRSAVHPSRGGFPRPARDSRVRRRPPRTRYAGSRPVAG